MNLFLQIKLYIFQKKKNSNYHIKSQVNFEEKNGKTLVHHKHELIIPFFLIPFKNILLKLVDRWSDILWEEDSEIMKIRYNRLQKGFKDGSHCGKWVFKDGKATFEFYDRN